MTNDPLAPFEASHIQDLKFICEEIGYGRVIQLAENWMEEKNPGWLKARDEVLIENSNAKV